MNNIPDMDSRDELLRRRGGGADEEHMETFAVGGYVRDRLLGRPGQDMDFVVVGDGPDLALKIMKRIQGHGWIVYPKFGTASFLWKDSKLEFVTARSESYSPESRKPDVQTGGLEGDLGRRDFTVNCLAMGLGSGRFGTIIHPL